MAGHDWKRLSFRGELRPFQKVMMKDDSDASKIRSWHCPKCGSVIVAEGGMKLKDARRRAKIPFDCDQQIVNAVHDL